MNSVRGGNYMHNFGKIFRRIISVLLVVGLIITVFMLDSNVSANSVSVSRDILESIINGNRKWVADTLVNDNYSTNPQAKLIHISADNSMMRNALNNYRNADNTTNGAVYKGMVDVMEKVVNADLYKQSFFDSVTETFSDIVVSIFGSGDSFTRTVDDLAGSLDELQYESIIKSALTADYTASDGTTYNDHENEYANLKQMQSALGAVNNWRNFVTASNNYAYGTAEYDSLSKYLDSCVIPYQNALTTYLMNYGNLANEDAYVQQNYADLAAALACIYKCEMYNADDWFVGKFANEMGEYFCESGINDVLKAAGKPFEATSAAIDNYVYLNNIQAQKESITGPLRRTASNTSDGDLAKVFNRFADISEENSNSKIVAYETVRNYVRNNNVAYEYSADAIKALSKKAFNIGSNTALVSKLSAVSTVADITTWVAEKGIDLKTTVKLTYELKYLDKIIDEVIKQYNTDLDTYLSHSTESNAQMVLDDLHFLQKLRLRGETIAYNMASGQMTSWIGQLISDESDLEIWKNNYQNHIDALISASVVPSATKVMTLSSNTSLSLYWSQNYGWYGVYKDSSGKIIYIADILSRLCYGVDITGGSLYIYNTTGSSLSIPAVSSNDTATLYVYGNCYIGNIKQNGGTLNIVGNENTYFTVTECLYAGNLNNGLQNGITAKNAVFLGAASGKYNITGDCRLSGNVDSLTLRANTAQSLSGGGTAKELYFYNSSKSGINVSSAVYVSEMALNTSTKVKNGKNVHLNSGGTVYGNYYHSDITLNSITLNKSVTFGGSIYTIGDFTCKGNLTVSGSYVVTENTNRVHRITENKIIIKGDAYLKYVTFENDNSFQLSGDLITNNFNSANSEITLNGKVMQTVSGTFTIKKLIVDNPSGITVNNTVSVTGTLSDTNGKIIGGKNIVLEKDAELTGDIWNGGLTFTALEKNNFTFGESICIQNEGSLIGNYIINGDITAKGNVTIRNSVIFCDNLYGSGNISLSNANITLENIQTSGKVIFNDTDISVNGFFICNGFESNKSTVVVKSFFKNHSSLKQDEKSILTVIDDFDCGSISSSGKIICSAEMNCSGSSLGELVLNGKLKQVVSGSFTVGTLTLTNTSKSGVIFNNNITVTSLFDSGNTKFSGNGIINCNEILNFSETMKNKLRNCFFLL